jgi:F-type H+-transporting ATPase subunit gamma
MTDRLAAITRRMETVRQLGAVATAMRGIAAARQREAESRLEAIRAYAATVGSAIGEALALAHGSAAPRDGKAEDEILILLAGEQGFAGAYSDRAIQAALAHLRQSADGPPATLMLAGSRGRMLAEAQGLKPAWTTTMPLHVREVADTANHIAQTLYALLAHGGVGSVTLLHASPDGASALQPFRAKTLIPFDYARFASHPGAIPPLVTMPADRLVAMLAEEYVFAELCEALMLAFAAESEARLRAMMSVSENIAKTSDVLAAAFRQGRQDAITEEVVELAAGFR